MSSNEYIIRVLDDEGAFEVMFGERRIKALLAAGHQVEGIDANTGKRYSILEKDGSLVATEITQH